MILGRERVERAVRLEGLEQEVLAREVAHERVHVEQPAVCRHGLRRIIAETDDVRRLVRGHQSDQGLMRHLGQQFHADIAVRAVELVDIRGYAAVFIHMRQRERHPLRRLRVRLRRGAEHARGAAVGYGVEPIAQLRDPQRGGGEHKAAVGPDDGVFRTRARVADEAPAVRPEPAAERVLKDAVLRQRRRAGRESAVRAEVCEFDLAPVEVFEVHAALRRGKAHDVFQLVLEQQLKAFVNAADTAVCAGEPERAAGAAHVRDLAGPVRLEALAAAAGPVQAERGVLRAVRVPVPVERPDAVPAARGEGRGPGALRRVERRTRLGPHRGARAARAVVDRAAADGGEARELKALERILRRRLRRNGRAPGAAARERQQRQRKCRRAPHAHTSPT